MKNLVMMGSLLNVIVLAMFIVAAVGIIRGRKQLSASGAKKTVDYVFSKKIMIVVLCLVFMVSCMGAQYAKNSSMPTLQVKLKFSEAANGQNPNKTRLNISKILSNEILEQVAERMGLEVGAKELADCLTIVTAYDEVEIDAGSDLQIATQYKVKCTEEILSLDVDAAELLTVLGEIYREEYLAEYSENTGILELSFDEVENADYLDAAAHMEMQAMKLRQYIATYSYANPSYRLADSGETFESLKEKIDNFIEIDLERYYSFALENGLSKSAAQYQTQMDYENLLLNVSYQKRMAAYDVRLEAIGIYESEMAETVLVPTTDEQQRFYMSRTRIGVDDFADEADTALEKATDLQKDMLHNTYARNQVANSASDSVYAKADTLLEELKAELTELSEQAQHMSNSFISDKRNGYMMITLEEENLSDWISGKDTVVMTGLFAVALVLLVAANFARKQKKLAEQA